MSTSAHTSARSRSDAYAYIYIHTYTYTYISTHRAPASGGSLARALRRTGIVLQVGRHRHPQDSAASSPASKIDRREACDAPDPLSHSKPVLPATFPRPTTAQATSAHDRSTSAQDSETFLCACPVFAQVFVLDWSMWKFNPSQYAAPSAAALCPSTAARLHRPHCTT